MKCNRIGFHLFSELKDHIQIPTVAATMKYAFQYHQGGLLQEAEKLYRLVLQNNQPRIGWHRTYLLIPDFLVSAFKAYDYNKSIS